MLREEQRRRGAFVDACAYVRENPVRAGLCVTWREWPFAGAMVAGYPDLEPRDPAYWELFWRIYAKLVEPALGWPVPARTRRASGGLDSSFRPGSHEPGYVGDSNVARFVRSGRTGRLRANCPASHEAGYGAVGLTPPPGS